METELTLFLLLLKLSAAMESLMIHLIPFFKAMGVSMYNSLLQGLTLFIGIKLLLHWIPAHKAKLRYNLIYTALLLLFGLFIYSLFAHWQFFHRNSLVVQHLGKDDILGQSGYPASSALQKGLSEAPGKLEYSPFFISLTPYLSVIYFIGLLLTGLRTGIQFYNLRQLKAAHFSAGEELALLLDTIKSKLTIRKPIVLRLSEKVNVPMLFGHIKPIVLLPLSLASRLSSHQLEIILTHELAHIKRNDYLWNIIQSLIENLMFFNPAAWFLSAMARQEREHCCDDYVTQKHDPFTYAETILQLATYQNDLSTAGLALSGTGKKNPLLNRIKRITMSTTNPRPFPATLTVVLFVAGILSLGMLVSSAQIAGKTDDDKRKKTTVTREADPSGNQTIEKMYIYEDENTNGTAQYKMKVYQMQDGDSLIAFSDNFGDFQEFSDSFLKDTDRFSTNIRQYMVDMDSLQVINEEAWARIPDISEELQGVFSEELSEEIESALKEAKIQLRKVDKEKLKSYMDAAKHQFDRINEEQLKQYMEEAKKQFGHIDKRQMRAYMDEARKKFNEANDRYIIMKKNRQELQNKAGEVKRRRSDFKRNRQYTRDTDLLGEKLKERGLISDPDKYSLIIENDDLYINGTKQSKKVADELIPLIEENDVLYGK